MANILQSATHRAKSVDPFGLRPCDCETIVVHITDGHGLADDIVECKTCKWSMPFKELYKDMRPPTSRRLSGQGGK